MKLRDLSFFAIVAIVVAGTQWLARIGRAPDIPDDGNHQVLLTAGFRNDAVRTRRNQCLACHHEPAMAQLERTKHHPFQWRSESSECTVCHYLRPIPSLLSGFF